MKEFVPLGSNFFPFRIDPFSEGDWCTEKQTGRHKSCLPCQKQWKNSNVSRVYVSSSLIVHGYTDLQGLAHHMTMERYHMQPIYLTVCLGFTKLLGKLVVKYPPDKAYKDR